jgi:hypothetical protein
VSSVSYPYSFVPDPDPAFGLNTDPDPGSDHDQKFKKINSQEKNFFFSKIAI